MNKRRVIPTQEELKVLFEYDPDTGNLIWRRRERSQLSSLKAYKIWNTRYAGKIVGCLTKDGVRVTLNKKGWAASRLIYKLLTNEEHVCIDHINLNNFDNKFENLRPATDATNGWNTSGRIGTISGLKGVCYDKNLKNKPWFATVTKNGKSHYGGHFSSKEEAFQRACLLREKLHGEFARHGKN